MNAYTDPESPEERARRSAIIKEAVEKAKKRTHNAVLSITPVKNHPKKFRS